MNNKGLTLSIVFKANSANYGENFNNMSVLKKFTRGDGNNYTYISRQSLRYEIVRILKFNSPDCLWKKDKDSVIQYKYDAKIDKYPEMDLFGYMKTQEKTSKKKNDSNEDNADSTNNKTLIRSAVVRLNNAVSLEPYNSDMEFMNNMGFAKRIEKDSNIFQKEIHNSLYSYTVTIDLDEIGEDKNDNIHLPLAEKARRVNLLLQSLKLLYKEIKGNSQSFMPLFIIGGLYNRKNPYFDEKINIKDNNLNIDRLLDAINIDEDVTKNTEIGYFSGTFDNEKDVLEKLHPEKIQIFFDNLCKKVEEYYA